MKTWVEALLQKSKEENIFLCFEIKIDSLGQEYHLAESNDGRQLIVRNCFIHSGEIFTDFYFRRDGKLKLYCRKSYASEKVNDFWPVIDNWINGNIPNLIKVYHPKPGECWHVFWCPACKETHTFDMKEWKVSGDLDSPSYSPSLRYPDCHLVLQNGIIHYCLDSHHELAGQHIPLVEF